MQAAAGHWLRDLFATALSTGVRRGELLALAWTDVDLDAAMLTIRKSLEQTKTGLRVKETKARKARHLTPPVNKRDLSTGENGEKRPDRRLRLAILVRIADFSFGSGERRNG